jgi:primosomal protein N' (replication factor Y)
MRIDVDGRGEGTSEQAALGLIELEDGSRLHDPDGGGQIDGALRYVEVAVDVPGAAGARTYTYHVPHILADLAPGEAVIVEYGRRRAIGIVLGSAARPTDRATKPIADRVRTDGPLLPPLTLELANWVSDHYLAPPAATIRSFLPPGFLERLELRAERTPTAAVGDIEPLDADLLEQLASGPRRVRDLDGPEGRAGLLRRLRSLEAAGLVTLDWFLSVAGAGPRFLRWLSLTPVGRDVATNVSAGERIAGRPLGPRQLAALTELAQNGTDGIAGTPLAERHGAGALAGLVRRGLVEVQLRAADRRALARRPPGRRAARPDGAPLLPEQAHAVAIIAKAIAAHDSTPLLLDGVTGAGKTAIYAEAIATSLEAGRPALLLVPEIALAMPIVDRLRATLDAEVALLHSALGDGERADEWRRIRSGAVDVVVGTRLALTAPLPDLGIVVVDEEHEAAYKSDRTPRLQARDAAVHLGGIAGAAVVLGSATPAVETVGNARAGRYRRVSLPARATDAPRPVIELVDLRSELAEGNRGLISRRLGQAIDELDVVTGDRAILVINRRGTASVVMCRDCGHVQACPECGLPLVFHQAGYTLRCHHCGTASPLASRCPACGSARIRYLGGGTERVEREVRERWPDLRIGRLDRDVVERRGAAERVLDAFADGRLDVLVGTSLVAKGLDIPEVTLVGVVSADVALNLPDERAAERTYQLLVQAVGRAGRGDRPGLAVIQTYQPGHPAIQAVVRDDAEAFYDAELELRRQFGTPPFGSLVKLTVGLPERVEAEAAAVDLAARLRDRARDRGTIVDVIGPAPAFVARRAGRWRFHLILRGGDPVELLDGGVDAPLSVDVDPESLL